MKLFFIVGEDSGDALGAPLIEALKDVRGDDLECMGIGGPLMREIEGFDELLPMDQISVIGIWEVLPKIPRLIKLKKSIVEEIEKQQPDAVVTIDFPDFNFLIAKDLKKRGVYKGKLIHYVAPSVWAWREKRAEKISKFMDGIMCLFPMEVEYFSKHGMKVAHVGHPIVASDVLEGDGVAFRHANNIPDDAKTIGLFFGSRESEFKNLGPIIKEATMIVDDVEQNIHIISPTLSKLEYDVQSLLEGFDLPIYVSANPMVKWDAFRACDVAIVVSGTAALELAYAGVPHVLIYKTSAFTAFILKLLVKTKYAHLANILLEDGIVPELIQGKCSSELIAEKAVELLRDEELCQKQRDAFKKLQPLLQCDNMMSPSENAAEFILNML